MQLRNYYRKLLAVSVCLMLLLAHTWVSYVTFHYPYIGIAVNEASDNKWVITDFYSNSITQYSDLMLNDEVISLDNLPVAQHFSVSKLHSVEQVRDIEVLRDGEILSFSFLDDRKMPSSRLIFTTIVEMILFSVALFLFLKAKPNTSTNILICMFILMGLAFMVAEASARSDLFSKIIIFSTVSIIPFMLVHFLYQLLSEKGHRLFSIKLITISYWVVLPICLLRLSYFSPFFNHKMYDIDRMVSLCCFAAGCLLCLTLLIYIYIQKRLEYSYSSSIIRTLLLTFSISFIPYIVLSVIPDIFSDPIVSYSTTMWFIFLFPILFLYFSYKRKLFQIHWGKLGKTLNKLGRYFPQFTLNYPIYKLLHNLQYVKQLDDLKLYFLKDLCSMLNVYNVSIVIIEEGKTKHWSHRNLEIDDLIPRLVNGQYRFERYRIHPIKIDTQFKCYLVLEGLLLNWKLSQSTKQWLNTVIISLSLVIDNIYMNRRMSNEIKQLLNDEYSDFDSIAKVSWLKKTIFQLMEQEKKRMASDLHDTLLQDILFVRQRVLSMHNSRLSLKEIDNQLADLAEYLHIINLNARDTIFQIYPHLLKETGFAAAISNLVETERSHSESELILQIEHAEEWNKLNFDDLLQLFRIIQELLSNARKHANANKISLYLWMSKNNEFVIAYKDDGIGLGQTESFEQTGWNGIRHRIQSMNANIHIESTSGEGLTLTITLPR